MAKRENSRGNRAAGRGRESGKEGSEGKKKDDYKAKRSFTRNKSFRTKQAEEVRGKRSSGGGPGRGPAFRERSGQPFRKKDGEDRGFREDQTDGKRRDSEAGKKTAFREGQRSGSGERKTGGSEERKFDREAGRTRPVRSGRPEEKGARRVKHGHFEEKAGIAGRTNSGPAPARKKDNDGLIRLNKYLSNAGIASRRDADKLILGGTVKVNGVVVDQLGYKIKPTDKVTYGDSAVKSERKVYLLLNKPKDYITTVEDPRERKTVMELIEGACRERVYPVGRLDRNTTGLLLFTNDGELTTKLIHPKFGIKKIYHVTLNKGLKPEHFREITEGVELEDGFIKADDLAFVGEGKKEIGIEIHSGRNRIVRRLFEHLGYDVLKLDRVVFAGLTKKDLPRGKYRFLTAKEISFLQMIG